MDSRQLDLAKQAAADLYVENLAAAHAGGAASSDGHSPVHSKSLTALYFPNVQLLVAFIETPPPAEDFEAQLAAFNAFLAIGHLASLEAAKPRPDREAQTRAQRQAEPRSEDEPAETAEPNDDDGGDGGSDDSGSGSDDSGPGSNDSGSGSDDSGHDGSGHG